MKAPSLPPAASNGQSAGERNLSMPTRPRALRSVRRPPRPRAPLRPKISRTSAPREDAASRSPPASSADLFEDLDGAFEEAGDHAAQRPEFGGFLLGPVLPLPIDSVTTGTVGWARHLTQRPPADAGGIGSFYLLVVPASSAPGSRLPAEPPLRGLCWQDFSVVETLGQRPTLLLLGRTVDQRQEKAVDHFARALLEALREELE
jgi:hypothetical protein